MTRILPSALCFALASSLLSCGSAPEPVDLLHPGDRLVEARAAGETRGVILKAVPRGLRVNDVLYRGFPAGPPGRLVFAVQVPRGGKLRFACAVHPEFRDRPAVEFFVKVRRDGQEDVVWNRLLDPISQEEDQAWVPGEVDLSDFSGKAIELVLETRGYEESGEPEAAWWGAPALVAPHETAPLVVLYLVDTLRADHTGVYGYERATTPELDAFAKDAIVFEQAIVHSSWTKPSVASILTSLLPGQHRAVQLRDALDPSNVTLARRLDEHGWATGAAIANAVIYGSESAFDPGFDVFAGLHGENDRRSKLVDADVVVDAALEFVRARRGFPTFQYVHTMDPHVPYAPPPPYDRMFEPHPVEGHPAQDPRTDYREPLDRDRMVAQYDGEVAYGDREFGRFLQALKDDGLYDDALIIFMADHGEEFLDHGLWLHGRSLFDELIRVPLLIKLPGNRHGGRRVDGQVEGVDIVPTVLEAMGLPVPSGLAGISLTAAVESGVPDRTALSEISHRGFVAHGVRGGKDKYIRRFSPDDDELYFDLVHDPAEKLNVIGEHPERVAALRAWGEKAMHPSPFRYVLDVSGAGPWSLRLEARGWIEDVEGEGFGPGEGWTPGGNGRWVQIGAGREEMPRRRLSFRVRPAGAPVTLTGERKGRLLRAAEVRVGASGWQPPGLPFRLPDIESEAERENGIDLFEPPEVGVPGVRVWLTLPEGQSLVELDEETRESLRALGYLGTESP